MIEKDFKDRIPTHPGRIKLMPVEGQQDVFDMTKADEPTENGTPINKAAFDSIIQSRLTGRYYEPSVTRTISGTSVVVNANPIPSSGWVHSSFMLSVYNGYSAFVNAEGGNYPGYAFDGDNNSYWVGAEGLKEHWLCIELPESITVKKIALKVQVETATNVPTIIIEGGNDNSNWTSLRTINGTQSFITEYSLNTTGEYKYYRIRTTYNALNKPYIYTFNIVQYETNKYYNSFEISEGLPLEWTSGQRITIKTPSNTNTFGVISNTLNEIPIGAILQPNKRYELTYNGVSFDAKEV